MADLKTVIEFLNGEGTLLGCEFGEKPFGERGQFWWRKHLTEAWRLHNNPTAIQADQCEDALNMVQAEQSLEVVAYYDAEHRDFSHVGRVGWGKLTDHAQATAEIARLQGEVEELLGAQHLNRNAIKFAREEIGTLNTNLASVREVLQGVADRCRGSGYVGMDGQYLKTIDAALSSQQEGDK